MSVTFATRIGPGFITTPTFEGMFFPAGEAHVKVINENSGVGPLTEVARVTGTDGNDLMMLAMWADAAHQRGAYTVAQIPYLPGARQDRGMPFGAAVYARFLNELHIDQIIAVDVHSSVMEHLVERLTIIDSAALIRRHVVGRPDSDQRAQRYTGIIAPDKGALNRAHGVAAICGLPLYKAEKHRDEATGQLSSFTCEPLDPQGRYLVVDDICDGGGTFLGLAAATGLPLDRLGLYVTHGVFSGGALLRLGRAFADIWTTDSFTPAVMPIPYLHTIPLATYLNGAIR